MTECKTCGQNIPTPKFEVGDVVRMDGTLYSGEALLLINGITHDGTPVLDKNISCKAKYLTLVYPAKVLEAVKGSWMKWDGIYRGTGLDTGSGNCPLCQMFYKTKSCVGCPIHTKLPDSRECGIHSQYLDNPTPANALAFRDWIGKLMPDSVMEELKKQVEPKEIKECKTCKWSSVISCYQEIGHSEELKIPIFFSIGELLLYRSEKEKGD